MRKEINEHNELDEQLGSQTNLQLEQERIRIDNELRSLDLELKREQVREIREKQQALRDKAASQKAAIDQFMAQRRARQVQCNHRKGGVGADGVIRGQGQSQMYCVVKHLLPAGNYLVLCQRCGKEWTGPLNAMQNGGVPKPATKGFFKAIQFVTNNTQSGSSRFDFSVAVPQLEDSDEEGDE